MADDQQSLGSITQQDFSDAVRPVFFQTDHEEFLYATHGGTLFLVIYEERVYALTCSHVFGDFPPGRLFVAKDKLAQKGSLPGHVVGLAYPSEPTHSAIDTDVTDLCVIRFSDDTPTNFFTDPYLINEHTVGSSGFGHKLLVAGVLKEKSSVAPPDINVGYCRLEFQDVGAHRDPYLRCAQAEFSNPSFSSVTGISGSPVFDQTTNKLCGMVVRGGMTENRCQIYYLDVFDIVRFLDAVRSEANSVFYVKTPPR